MPPRGVCLYRGGCLLGGGIALGGGQKGVFWRGSLINSYIGKTRGVVKKGYTLILGRIMNPKTVYEGVFGVKKSHNRYGKKGVFFSILKSRTTFGKSPPEGQNTPF